MSKSVVKRKPCKCEVCSAGEPERRLIRYSLSIGERLVLVDHAPAWVCDRRGETTLEPEVVERLQETIRSSEKPSKVIATPVYEFA